MIMKNHHYRRKSKATLMREINITPLVDVMLVLLIVFMITSPMLVAGVNVDLPETKAVPIASQNEPLVITIDSKGKLFLFETEIASTSLVTKLMHITKENKGVRIFVRGDKHVAYGEIVDVIAQIHDAGFHKVALISNIKDGT